MNSPETLVTSYVDPDLDGFACAFAYAEFLNLTGHPAVLGLTGSLHEEAKFLLQQYSIPFEPADKNPADFAKIILVDASDREGIDPRIDPAKVAEIIDHRRVNQQELFPNAQVQNEPVGSAATLIAEKFMAVKVSMSKNSAVLLYGAIVSNTLNFQANVTTARDKNAAQWLALLILPSSNFALELFQSKSNITKENLGQHIDHDFARFDLGSKIGVAQLELVNAAQLVTELKPEILIKLNQLKQAENLDLIFLSLIDLNQQQNIFVTDDSAAQDLLQSILQIKFVDNAATRSGFIMRKELMPLIKDKTQ